MAYQLSKVKPPKSFYIPGELHVGKQFIIRGKVPHGSRGFAINFQEKDHDQGDIFLHFNPRTSENVVVRNSYDGGWMQEERDARHFPFNEGATFTIRLQVTDDAFKVFVNGHHFCDFDHRLNYRKAKYLFLGDGAEYHDLTFQDNYHMPYCAEMPGGMEVGKSVRIRGVATDSDGFSLNFACDSNNDTCAFHFNPRPREGCVVKNANLGGWGEEERDYDDFPFSPGSYFDLLFVCTPEGFSTYANESDEFSTFNHRCPINKIRYFIARGDADIADVEYYEPLEDDFVKDIPSGLEKGDTIFCRGFFRPGGDSFSINLMNGDSMRSDIAFHFNPRRGEGQVVMNSCFGGWGDEERQDLPDVFARNIPFEVKIVTKSNKFKVFVNGVKYAVYAARGSVEDIKGVNVRGDVYMYKVQLNRKMDKPYTEKIPGGLNIGGWLIVHGTPKKNKTGFAINLRCGRQDDTDIALHFNARLNENTTVRNTMSDGDWGDEERDQPGFPFEKKDTFEVAIQAKPDKFVTFVNGEHYIDYDHRLPLDSICHVNLTGDADFFEPEFFF